MNRDAYLTGSTMLQYLQYKLHSCRAVQSLSVAGLTVQTASIIRTIGQSAAYQTLLMIMKDGALCLPFFFKPLAKYFLTCKLSCHNVFVQTSHAFLRIQNYFLKFAAPYNYDYHRCKKKKTTL